MATFDPDATPTPDDWRAACRVIASLRKQNRRLVDALKMIRDRLASVGFTIPETHESVKKRRGW